MSLSLVATPIGNLKDISLRALEILQGAEIIVGEDLRVASTLLKRLKIENKEIYLLNEHSKQDDIQELLDFCKTKNVALMSDCGTPVFCDPGSVLIKECRKNKIAVTAVPGASSLMALLSLSSEKLNAFNFVGFLPQEKNDRATELKKLSQIKTPFVLMDTPYRLNQLLEELSIAMPQRKALLGLDLTAENEEVFEDKLSELVKKVPKGKREFILLVY